MSKANEILQSPIISQQGFHPLPDFQEVMDNKGKAVYLSDTNNFWGRNQEMAHEITIIKEMVNQTEFPKDKYIQLIAGLTYQQRIALKAVLDKETNKLLDKKVNNMGDCITMITMLFANPIEVDSRLIWDSISAFGNDYATLVNIPASSSNWTLKHIANMFKCLYNIELNKYLIGNCSKDLGPFLVCLYKGEREENKTPKIEQCEKDVTELIKVGFKWSPENVILQKVIYERSSADIILIDQELQKQKKMSFDEAFQQAKNSSDMTKNITQFLEVMIGSKTFYNKILKDIKSNKGASLVNRLIFSKKQINHDILIEPIQGSPDKNSISKDTMKLFKDLVLNSMKA